MCSDYSPSKQEMKKLEERIGKNEKDSEAMASSYAVEKERMEAKTREQEQEAKKERERVKVEYDEQLADFTRRLQDETNVSAAYRTRLEEKIKELQDRTPTAYV